MSHKYGPALGLLLTYSIMAVMFTTMIDDQPTMASFRARDLVQTDSGSSICICLADNRFTEGDLALAGATSIEELHRIIRQDPKPLVKWAYWRKTALINKAYALNFKHDVINVKSISLPIHFQ